jgi:hypothetical protein
LLRLSMVVYPCFLLKPSDTLEMFNDTMGRSMVFFCFGLLVSC